MQFEVLNYFYEDADTAFWANTWLNAWYPVVSFAL